MELVDYRTMSQLTEKQLKDAFRLAGSVEAELSNEEHRKRFVECAEYFGLLNKKGMPDKSETIRRLIDESWRNIQAKKRTLDPHMASTFGLKSIVYFGAAQEELLLDIVRGSRRLTVIGEDFGWLSDPMRLYEAIRIRFGAKRPSRILTPHPEFKPEPDRDARLRTIAEFVADGRWDVAKASIAGNLVMRLIGINRLAPYTAIMGDDEIWIRHSLGATARYKTLWIYERTDSPENFYTQLEADLKMLEDEAMARPGWDLVDRYRPT